MRLLLDTHVLIWAIGRPARLTKQARAAIEDGRNEILVSAASAWEAATKYRLGKFPEAAPVVLAFEQQLAEFDAREVPITARHALAAGTLEWSNQDPFDRIIATQSVLESAVLVTADPAFKQIAGLQILTT